MSKASILALALAAWPTISAAINVIFRLESPEDLIALAARYPRTEAALRFCRSAGLDPLRALRALRDLVRPPALGDRVTPLIPPAPPPQETQ